MTPAMVRASRRKSSLRLDLPDNEPTLGDSDSTSDAVIEVQTVMFHKARRAQMPA
jgi:hypothetical protein